MSRRHLSVFILVPVVLAAGVGAAVLPRAIAARQTADDTTAAAATQAVAPSGVVTVLSDAPVDEVPMRGRAVTTPTGPVALVIEAVPPPPVDGSAAAPVAAPVDGAPVDAAAAEAEASSALTGHVVVTDGSTGIPTTVLAAYRRAEANLAAAKPSCHLPWWVLAGIGRIESGHASGGRVDAAGTTRGRIVGVALDGSIPGTAVILDSDGGRWDGDTTYDRAVGPTQFLPGSWRAYGKDGNGDGVADPNNVFDAATAAGYLLCTAGDLSDPGNLSRAVLSYNHSASYVASVLRWGAAYRDGVTPSPDSAGTVPAGPVRQPATVPTTTATAPTSSSPPPASPSAPASSSRSTAPPPPTSSSTSPTSSTSATSSTSPSSSASATSPTSSSAATSSSSTTKPTTSTATTTTPAVTTTTPSTTTAPSTAATSATSTGPVPDAGTGG